MCLIIFSYADHPRYRLAVAANRDEFRRRPARPVHFWPDAPEILAGRDLTGGGTWMGVSRSGRFAALTNFRDPGSVRKDGPSRGDLVTEFLRSDLPARDCIRTISGDRRYNGFNLLAFDGSALCYYGDRDGEVRRVSPGLHGLSNHLLDTPWPKVERAEAALSAPLAENPVDPEALFRVLSDRSRPPDERLPDTGMGLAWERLLSPIFIAGDLYGTRCASVVLISHSGKVDFWERTFVRVPEGVVAAGTRRFEIPPAHGET